MCAISCMLFHRWGQPVSRVIILFILFGLEIMVLLNINNYYEFVCSVTLICIILSKGCALKALKDRVFYLLRFI